MTSTARAKAAPEPAPMGETRGSPPPGAIKPGLLRRTILAELFVATCLFYPGAPIWLGPASAAVAIAFLVWRGGYHAGVSCDDLAQRGYGDLRPGDAASVLEFAEGAATRAGYPKGGAAMIRKLPPREHLAITPIYRGDYEAGSLVEALRLLEEQARLGPPKLDGAA